MPTIDVRSKLNCPRVLIVDDDPLIRSLVRTVLEDEEYELSEAEDGDQALDKAREQCPDVVLLDVMMPGADGYQVAESLRRDVSPDCVIIMLTARDQASDRERGFLGQWHGRPWESQWVRRAVILPWRRQTSPSCRTT